MTNKSLEESVAINTDTFSTNGAPHRGLRQHFTETQLIIVGMWLGLPIAAFILSWLINPVYEAKFFMPGFATTGTVLLIGCVVAEIINALALYFGFRIINHFLPIDQSSRFWRATLISLLTILTFLLCTLPILSIILLGPAAIVISQQPIH
jgi:hypothetical protein